jgi:hypothetical protein
MRKRKSSVPEGPRPNDGWEIQTEMTINGRHVKPGTELKVKGWTGRYQFVKYVKTEKGIEWIDLLGEDGFRSCDPDRIKRVHYKNKTDANIVKELKERKKAAKEENEEQE